MARSRDTSFFLSVCKWVIRLDAPVRLVAFFLRLNADAVFFLRPFGLPFAVLVLVVTADFPQNLQIFDRGWIDFPHLGHGFDGALRFFAIGNLQRCEYPVQLDHLSKLVSP